MEVGGFEFDLCCHSFFLFYHSFCFRIVCTLSFRFRNHNDHNTTKSISSVVFGKIVQSPEFIFGNRVAILSSGYTFKEALNSNTHIIYF